MSTLLNDAAQWTPAPSVDGLFHFDLGERRVNWNRASWAVIRLAESQDWQPASRLRICVHCPQPRADLGLMIGVQRQGQCWYAHTWACSLAAEECTGEVCIADFTPAEWYAPNGESHVDGVGVCDGVGVSAIAIGVCDPRGAGSVAIKLRSLECLPPLAQPASAHIRGDGHWLQVGDTTMVPPGVFGSFNLPAGHVARYRLGSTRRIEHTGLAAQHHCPSEGEAFVIHTAGDRVRPSPRLTHADWAERSAAAGQALAEQAAAAGLHPVVEYWNEPYLNWANRNRANFIPHLYDVDQASEGAQAHIAHDGSPVPHLRWTKRYELPPWQWCSERDWRRGIDAQGQQHSAVHAPAYKGMDHIYGGSWQPSRHPEAGCAEGDRYTVEVDGEALALRAATPWHLYDESQFTYWSASAMVPLYVDPARAFGAALKASDPQATFIIGWGNRPSEDHWAAWELIYRPSIDALIDFADGICEHDYGGDPSKMAAVYELVNTYTMTRYNKKMTGWNTECAGATDPQAVPAADDMALSGGADLRKCRWTMRKVVHLLATVPDLARNCAHFGYGGSWWSDSGEGVAMDCLRALRGRMLHISSDDPSVLVVAAVDGTDPRCPRPDDLGPGNDMVIALLNDSGLPRRAAISCAPPQGCRCLSGQILRPVPAADGSMEVSVHGITVSPEGVQTEVQLQPWEVQVLRIPLQGQPGAGPLCHRRQYHCPKHLAEVLADQPWQGTITIPAQELAAAHGATLRVVVEHLAGDAAVMSVNGHELTLPACPTAENGARMRDLNIPCSWLSEETTLSCRLSGRDRPGLRLVCVSVFLDSLA